MRQEIHAGSVPRLQARRRQIHLLMELPLQGQEIKNKPEKEENLLSEEFEYASAIIGKTVVEATKVCNELSLKDDQDKVELVNLVLGRTEILKAETLKILSSELDFEQKKDLMQNEQSAAFDYFDSIKAQIG